MGRDLSMLDLGESPKFESPPPKIFWPKLHFLHYLLFIIYSFLFIVCIKHTCVPPTVERDRRAWVSPLEIVILALLARLA